MSNLKARGASENPNCSESPTLDRPRGDGPMCSYESMAAKGLSDTTPPAVKRGRSGRHRRARAATDRRVVAACQFGLMTGRACRGGGTRRVFSR